MYTFEVAQLQHECDYDQKIDGSCQVCSGRFDNSHSVCYGLAPASATDWSIKGNAMCCHVCVLIHVYDPQLSVLIAGHCRKQISVRPVYTPHKLSDIVT